VGSILKRNNLHVSDIAHWIIHPGGKSIIDGVQGMYELRDQQVSGSRSVLRDYGNMSSPTVLFVLNKLLQTEKPALGDRGIVLAMGPGLAAYTALFQWG